MARRVPHALVGHRAPRDWQKGFFSNTRIARLVESEDLNVMVGVLLDDPLSFIIGVEGVHEDKWHVNLVLLIQMLRECAF